MKKYVAAVIMGTALVMSLTGCGSKNTNQALKNIEDAGVLKVSVSPDFAPYEFEDPSKTGQDSYVGSDMELARYIADKLGVELEIVPMDFDACLAGVTQNKVDISISAFYPSEDRKKIVAFSDAYFDDSQQCVVIKKENADKFSTQESLEGASIAAQNGSAQYDIAQEQIKDCKLQAVSKATDGVQMVKSNKVDGILLQAVMAESIVAADDTLAISGAVYTYDESELVIALNKNEDALLGKLNEIVKEVNDQGLYGQWLVDAQQKAVEIVSE